MLWLFVHIWKTMYLPCPELIFSRGSSLLGDCSFISTLGSGSGNGGGEAWDELSFLFSSSSLLISPIVTAFEGG